MSIRLTSFAISGDVFSLPQPSNARFASTIYGLISLSLPKFGFRHFDSGGHLHSFVAGFFFAAADCFVFGFLAPGARSASAFLFVGLAAAAVFGFLAGAAVFAAFFGFVALDAAVFFLGGMLRVRVRSRVAFRESD